MSSEIKQNRDRYIVPHKGLLQTWAERLYSKFIISVMRVAITVHFFFSKDLVRPTRVIAVPSTKDKSRTIRCNLHEPSNYDGNAGALPVHINLHGSGFALPLLGSDSRFIAHWADELECIIVDADYSKGPERPFPSACDDVMDIIAYIHSKPSLYDAKRVTIGGFSAGANLALGAALRLPGAFSAIIAFYPSRDWSRPFSPASKPLGSNPGTALGKWMQKAFSTAYLTPGVDLRDPRLSPIYGTLENSPPALVITCECDSIASEGEDMVAGMRQAGVEVEHFHVLDAGHAWERFAKPGTPQFDARDRAFHLARETLRRAYSQ